MKYKGKQDTICPVVKQLYYQKMEASDETVAGLLLHIRDRIRLVEHMFLKIASCIISALHNEMYYQALSLKLQKFFLFWFYN